MRIKGYPQKKNKLIGRLGTITGKRAVYNGAPDFSYDIGDYRVFRDGSVAVLEECLAPSVLDALISEKLLVDPNDNTTFMHEDTAPAEADEGQDRGSEVTKQTVTSPAWNFGIATEAHIYDDPIVVTPGTVSVQTMTNLLNLLYSKGEILSQALGKQRAFWISEMIIVEILYQQPVSYQSLMKIIGTEQKTDLVKGIEFKPDAVIFTGFPQTDDFLKRKAYEKLAESLYNYADKRRWITSRRIEVQNEKYFCRNFLNQIGLLGKENKTVRAILLKNLQGNSSYRTKAQIIADRKRRSENYVSKRSAS